MQGFKVHYFTRAVLSADLCGSKLCYRLRIVADSCIYFRWKVSYFDMKSRSTRNSQAAAFDAINPSSSVASSSLPRTSTSDPPAPSTSQALTSDQPSPAFLASVISAVKQALVAEQASNLPAPPAATSAASVPIAAPLGGRSWFVFWPARCPSLWRWVFVCLFGCCQFYGPR